MTADYPFVRADEIGWLTESDMIEVDRVTMQELRIELIQMMENAGRSLARLVLDRFDPRTVTVLAGSGGNGGGGLVAARHLANTGVDVSVTLGQSPNALAPVPSHQYDIIERMGVSVIEEPARADVVIDALIGYSLRGAPRGRVGELVERIGDVGDRVVALDTPSGMDVTNGSVPGVAVTAHLTMTLGVPKIGLRGKDRIGELYLADISIPPLVYATIGVGPAPDFTSSSILRILPADASADAGGASS